MGGGGGIGGAISGAVGGITRAAENIAKNPTNVGHWMNAGRAGLGAGVTVADPWNLTGAAGKVGGWSPGGANSDSFGQAPGGGGGGGPGLPMPGSPTFESQIDPETGLLKKQYQQQSQLNEKGLEALRSEALRDPSQMSRWRQIAQTQGMDQLGRQQANQLAQAQSGLASAGGLSQGARERLQQQNMQSGLMNQQNMWTNLAAQDEQKRQAALAGLPGQELAAAGYKSGIGGGNIQSALDEINKKRAFDLARYQEQMRAWGAQQTANAIPVPQDKGFIGNMLEGIF